MSQKSGSRVVLVKLAECPRCGEVVDLFGDHDCDGELPFDSDRCPMCGEKYQSYTTHIQQCSGGR